MTVPVSPRVSYHVAISTVALFEDEADSGHVITWFALHSIKAGG